MEDVDFDIDFDMLLLLLLLLLLDMMDLDLGVVLKKVSILSSLNVDVKDASMGVIAMVAGVELVVVVVDDLDLMNLWLGVTAPSE